MTAAVRERRLERARPVDDVTVREQETVGREEETRSTSTPFTAASTLADLDVHYRRADPLRGGRDCARVGVEKVVVRRNRERRGLVQIRSHLEYENKGVFPDRVLWSAALSVFPTKNAAEAAAL